jgi:error-prone DNA polymerase
MVHPYLRRRNGEEAVTYPSEALRSVLEKTMGVPLFQEQAMKIAIVAAGFTPAEADRLRRAMATFRHTGGIDRFEARFIQGMIENGYEPAFAERCFRQIEGFGNYGFPESHATSFALLVYVSSWLKCHHPEVFACALLNSQPMGFYAPAQIARDAREHGVQVLPVDVNASHWDCTLEHAPLDAEHDSVPARSPAQPPRRYPTISGGWAGERAGTESWKESERAGATFNQNHLALRLGFRQVKGLKEPAMGRLVALRGNGYADLADLRRRAGLDARALDHLARADAFRSLSLDRRRAIWSAIGLDRTGRELDLPPLFAWAEGQTARPEPAVSLPKMSLGQEVAEDYANLKLSLRCHPLALLRPLLPGRLVPAGALASIADGARVELAGLVLVRQRPGTASGVIFITLEDETGVANLVVWPKLFQRQRREVLGGQLLIVRGRLQKEGLVIHIIAERLTGRNDLLHRLGEIEAPVARADEVKRPAYDRRVQGFRSRDFH